MDDSFWLDGAEQIGENEWIRRTVNRAGEPVGLIEIHRAPDGHICTGSVTFDLPAAREAESPAEAQRPHWTVNSLQPLDLSPSLLCTACGHHGHIKNGRWVPC